MVGGGVKEGRERATAEVAEVAEVVVTAVAPPRDQRCMCTYHMPGAGGGGGW
jgi:hypothetical protein